jgi:hypothetical protein
MKKQTNLIAVTLATLTLLGTAPVSQADDDGFFSFFSRHKEIVPMTDASYNKECGSCHFPYQAGLLPEGSWRKLMEAKALADHFGENAELDEQTRSHILKVLVDNSADKSSYKRSKKVMGSLESGATPLRITEVPYIKEKHDEVPQKLIKQPKVKSLSYCDKCHMKADEGNYDDDTVVIPDHGNWTW